MEYREAERERLSLDALPESDGWNEGRRREIVKETEVSGRVRELNHSDVP